MNKLENRLALRETLRDIHRKTLLRAVISTGLIAYESKVDDLRAITPEQAREYDLFINVIDYDTKAIPVNVHRSRTLDNLSSSVLGQGGDLASLINPEALGITGIAGHGSAHNPHPFIDIYCIPDSPPFALHEDDVSYVLKGKCDTADDAMEAMTGIKETFGDEAVEYLGEQACGVLIRELPTMNPTPFLWSA